MALNFTNNSDSANSIQFVSSIDFPIGSPIYYKQVGSSKNYTIAGSSGNKTITISFTGLSTSTKSFFFAFSDPLIISDNYLSNVYSSGTIIINSVNTTASNPGTVNLYDYEYSSQGSDLSILPEFIISKKISGTPNSYTAIKFGHINLPTSTWDSLKETSDEYSGLIGGTNYYLASTTGKITTSANNYLLFKALTRNRAFVNLNYSIFNWNNSSSSWKSSDNIDLTTGKTYKINGSIVLSSTQVLGKSVPSGAIVGTSDSQNLTNKTINGLTYPTSDGSSGQAIITDGSGGLSFGTVSGGGASISFSSSTDFPLGSPVYFNSSGTWQLAIANLDTSTVQFVISQKTGSGTFSYVGLTSGELTLTTSQWDTITGGSDGLTTGASYFLSSTIAGKISKAVGLIYAPVLRAISSTKAFVSLSINSIESGAGDTFYRETTTTVATTSSITLTYPPAGKAYTLLSIDGVIQSGNDFSLAGNTLILGESIPSGTLIDVMYARSVLLADSNAINKMVAFSETVTGSDKTTFNLPSVPSDISSCMVFVGGAIQDSTKFNISGNVLTMTDPVPVGVQLIAYVLNSSGISNSIDSYMTRQTYSLPTSGTVNISTIFGSQISGLYLFFDINDPRISGTILLKHNGTGVDPDVRVDSNSGSVSIVIDTESKLNIYIVSNLLTFQNNTSNTTSLRIYRKI